VEIEEIVEGGTKGVETQPGQETAGQGGPEWFGTEEWWQMLSRSGPRPEDHKPEISHSPEPGGDSGEFEHRRGFADPVQHRVIVAIPSTRAGLPFPPMSDGSSNHPNQQQPTQPGPCAIVVSRYNDSITSVMLDGAVSAYLQAGGREDSLAIVEALGAYELVSIANAAAGSGMYVSVVCLGCVIKGETEHDVHISSAVANGLAEISIKTGVPVAFGVLTTKTIEQAIARAGGADGKMGGNKGAEAMGAVLGAAGAIDALGRGKKMNTPGIRHAPGFEVPDKATIAGEGA